MKLTKRELNIVRDALYKNHGDPTEIELILAKIQTESAESSRNEATTICKYPVCDKRRPKFNGMPYCRVYKGICKCK